MILGIIIGLFIVGCVGVVVMAIMQMAKENKPLDVPEKVKEDKNPLFLCPSCGKGQGTIGYGGFIFCPKCGYRTKTFHDIGAAYKEWNEAAAIKHNCAKIPSNCRKCLTTTAYGRVFECNVYKRLKQDPLSTRWLNGITRGDDLHGRDCPLNKEEKGDEDKDRHAE